MQPRLRRTLRVIELVARATLADRVTFLAASISFYAVLSLFPMLLLVLVLGSYFGGEAFAESILDVTQELLAPQALETLREGLLSDEGRGGAGVVGVLVLLWSSLKVFRGLDIAFSTVYGEPEEADFLTTVIHSLIVLAAVGVGIAAILVIQGAGAVLPLSWLYTVLAPFMTFLALTILFFPLYFIFPGVDHSPQAVIPGTVVAAAGWTILSELFGVYAANAGTFALFGIVGTFLLLLMWFYFGAIVLLVGAVLNAVIDGRCDEETINQGFEVQRPIGQGDEV